MTRLLRSHRPRLGVNIDHVATLRNARGGGHPCPVRAAQMAQSAGADGITAHLREDRRHIREEDLTRIIAEIPLPLNLEMAATREMLTFARTLRPNAVCLVPERREERTTEGGLDVAGQRALLAPFVDALQDAGIRVSLFIEAGLSHIDTAAALGVEIVEFHTGAYCHAHGEARKDIYDQLFIAIQHASLAGLEVHAGHGLDYESVGPIAAIPEIAELNIGHFLVSEGLFVGFDTAIRTMRQHMDCA